MEKDISGSGVSEVPAGFSTSQTSGEQLIWLHQLQARGQDRCRTEVWDSQSVSKNILTF